MIRSILKHLHQYAYLDDTLQAHLCISRVQLCTEQLGIRVTDVLDAKEALQATRQADGHLEVCYLLHAAQNQHAFLHTLENRQDTVLKTLSQNHHKKYDLMQPLKLFGLYGIFFK